MVVNPTPTMLSIELDSLTDEQKLLLDKWDYPLGVIVFYSTTGTELYIKGGPDKLYKVLLDLSYTFDIEIV